MPPMGVQSLLSPPLTFLLLQMASVLSQLLSSCCVVIKHYDPKQLGERDYLAYTSRS